MPITDNLDKLVTYAIEHFADESMEFEVRFGKYSRISSNLSQNTFFQILALASGKSKTYQMIDETFYGDIRQRIIYNDEAKSQPLIKKVFDNTASVAIADVKNVLSALRADSPSITKFISKDKIMRVKPTPNYKAEIVSENILNESEAKSQMQSPKLKKHKMRCSWVDAMWRFDTTILLIHDLKTDKCGVFFEVEIEYIAGKSNKFEQVSYKMNELINAVTTIIECLPCRGKTNTQSIQVKYGMFNSVVTLERKDLATLESANYAVVDKADGERRFVQIDGNGNVCHFNPTDTIPDKISLGKSALKNTVIDCELEHGVFYGFDLLFCNGQDYRSYNLPTRLAALTKVVAGLVKSIKGAKFKTKTFYLSNVFAAAKKIWDTRAKFNYELDGLIFTPISGAYIGNLPNFKFKPKVSIDVRIMYNQRDDFTEFYPNSYPIIRGDRVINEYTDYKTKKLYYKSRFTLTDNTLTSMNVVNKYGVLGMSGKIELPNMVNIVEMEYDPKTKLWEYLRTRPDKETPNAYKTVLSALMAIKDDITIGDIGKLKHKKSLYERIGTVDKNCFSTIGFKFDSSNISSEVCSFYSSAYSNLLNSTNKKSIIVLGCDMCLLNGLLNSNFALITIIENSCLEVYGEAKSEGYTGLCEQVRLRNLKTAQKINIVWGNPFTLKAYNKQGATVLKSEMSAKPYDAVFINSLESCLVSSANSNVVFSKSTYDGFMQRLKSILNPKGIMMGTFLSADKIMACLNKPCVLLRNKDLHPLWKLQIKPLTKYKKDDLFLNKPQMLEINRVQNSFVAEHQPAVFDSNIKKLIPGVKCNSMKSLSDQRLNVYDSVIANITKYFII